MVKKTISRRDFLRVSALAAAGAALASCGPKATEAPAGGEAPATEAPAGGEAPPAEGVVLDIMSLAEYQAPYQEIWNIYAGENPGVTANVFAVNEDTAAAYEAKVAGGYLAAIELTQELQIFFDKSNYEMALDLSTLEFDWWDRFTFDAKNAWSDLH
nr:twin-arginine translocation signal domain-containing protein [Anaerolineaceae bacterium]